VLQVLCGELRDRPPGRRAVRSDWGIRRPVHPLGSSESGGGLWGCDSGALWWMVLSLPFIIIIIMIIIIMILMVISSSHHHDDHHHDPHGYHHGHHDHHDHYHHGKAPL
jgi:hypothetical protein